MMPVPLLHANLSPRLLREESFLGNDIGNLFGKDHVAVRISKMQRLQSRNSNTDTRKHRRSTFQSTGWGGDWG